jgi:hypothetical protein
MSCKNEWCDPETGNDCADCFAIRDNNFRLALETRKTPEFLALQAVYAESQKIADTAYLEICKTFKFTDIIWVAFYSGDIYPQHQSPENDTDLTYE